jgi:hypothetical protein
MAVREMSGQLFLMAAQYLYFEGNKAKSASNHCAANPLLVIFPYLEADSFPVGMFSVIFFAEPSW